MKTILFITSMILGSAIAVSCAHANPAEAYLMYDRNGPTYAYTSSTESLGVPTNSMNSLVTTSRSGIPSAQLITMPSGSYLIVPNTTTGRVMSVIQTSRGK